MPPEDPSRQLEELERTWALPSDATPLERALAYHPRCGAGWIYRNRVVAILCRAQGLPLPWPTQPPRERPSSEAA